MRAGAGGVIAARGNRAVSPARSDLRQLMFEIGFPLLLLAAVEMGFRSYVARPGAALMPRLFQSQLTTAKYLGYRQLAAQGPPLDVMLMGMSQVMRVRAAELSAHLEARHGLRITAFNFAAPAETVAYDQRLLGDILLPLKKPRIIVYGIIPTNLLMDVSPERTAEWIRAWPIFALSASTSPSAWLQRALTYRVDLLLYREAIRELLAPGPGQVDPMLRAALATDGRGDTPILFKQRKVATRLNAWERRLVPQFADFDRLVRDTPLFANIERLAAFLRERDIQLVVMNNPVSPIYLDLLPGGLDDYRMFVGQLGGAAARAQVPFFNPVPDGSGDPQLYSDATHHNEAGVAWITGELAEFLVRQGIVGGQQE